MKLRNLLFLVLIGLVAPAVSNAQTATLVLEVTFEVITHHPDGTPGRVPDGFMLHYGVESEKYTTFIDLGNNTEYAFVIRNVPPGVLYHFAVTAYADIDGQLMHSDYSNEITYQVPTEFEAPETVINLKFKTSVIIIKGPAAPTP